MRYTLPALPMRVATRSSQPLPPTSPAPLKLRYSSIVYVINNVSSKFSTFLPVLKSYIANQFNSPLAHQHLLRPVDASPPSPLCVAVVTEDRPFAGGDRS